MVNATLEKIKKFMLLQNFISIFPEIGLNKYNFYNLLLVLNLLFKEGVGRGGGVMWL